MGAGKDVTPTSIYSATDAPFYAALGIQSQATEETAKAYDSQARLVAQESRRSAELVARNARELVSQNSLEYTSSGVSASVGSPIAVAREIAKRAKQDVNAYINQGLAQATNLRRQGYLTRAQGRASILGQQTQYTMGALGAQVGAIQPNGLGLLTGNALTAISGGLFSRAFQGSGSAAAPTAGVANPYAASSIPSLLSIHGPLGI